MFCHDSPTVDRLEVRSYRVPTETPESDGTLQWDATGVVVVRVSGGKEAGLGYTYAPPRTTAALVREMLEAQVVGQAAFTVPTITRAMTRAVRNAGRPGVAAEAISAVDTALWDLKARLLNVSLVHLLGSVRDAMPVYGSGGFTSYDQRTLVEQLSGWIEQGIGRVKMKVGRDAAQDPARVRAAREAIGPDPELFVDANGAYDVKQAIDMGRRFAEESAVTWYEEPRPPTDAAGLRRVRERAPPGMEIATGEYGYQLSDYRGWIEAGAADCLQADVTRCGGITGLVEVAALCEAHSLPMSHHCAPALAAPVCCCLRPMRHVEYFHDHARIEAMFFDGTFDPAGGTMEPDRSRPGLGLTLKQQNAEAYAV